MPPQEDSADTAEVQKLLAKGNSKSAVEAAKKLHKRAGTPATEALLVQAYLARARSMMEHNLAPEAEALLAMVRERYPSTAGDVKDFQSALAAEAGSLDDLLRPLNDPPLSSKRRAAIELHIRNRLTDPAVLARCTVLAPEHPLRQSAAALEKAFQAVTSGPVEDAALALPEISRRSPLAPWKPLLRAIACFHRRDDAACEENLRAIDPESAPARLVRPLRAMLSGSGSSTLAAQVGGDFHHLRAALRALDAAFDSGQKKRVLPAIREAVSWAQRDCPEIMDSLRQHVTAQSMIEDWQDNAVTSALGGAARRDARFSSVLARALETDQEKSILACICWEEFRQRALHERWFREDGPEAATLYLHMAEVATRIPPEEIDAARENFRLQPSFDGESGEPPPPVDLAFLQPDWLFERACTLDPHPEAFQSWMAWAENSPKKSAAETVARAWHRALPNDSRPLLRLMHDAESRNALKKATGYLEEVEALDGLNPEVRRARLRLLLRSVMEHLTRRKTHLAEKELAALESLPQARENDRPAFVAGLRLAACLVAGDDTGIAAAQQQIDRLLGGRRAGALVATGVAQLCGLSWRLPAKAALADSQSWVASMARVAAMGHDLGLSFFIPDEWLPDIFRDLGKPDSIDTAVLHTLGKAALRQNARELAFVISAAGLARGGPGESRFLLLRARALPEWLEERRDDCLAAAIELGRRERDMDLVAEALDARRESFLGALREAIPLGQPQVKTVLNRERRDHKFPAERSYEDEFFDDDPFSFDDELPPPRPPRRRKKRSGHTPVQEELF